MIVPFSVLLLSHVLSTANTIGCACEGEKPLSCSQAVTSAPDFDFLLNHLSVKREARERYCCVYS
jgi:hypothetical protein